MHLAGLFIQSNLQKKNKTTIMYIIYLFYFNILPRMHAHTLFYIYYTIHKDKYCARKCKFFLYFGLSVPSQSAWVIVTYSRCWNGVITAMGHVVEIWRDLVKKWGLMHREVWIGGERKATFMHNKIKLSSQVTFFLGFLPFVLCL